MKKNEHLINFLVCVVCVLSIACVSLFAVLVSANDGHKRLLIERNGLQNQVYELQKQNEWLKSDLTDSGWVTSYAYCAQ